MSYIYIYIYTYRKLKNLPRKRNRVSRRNSHKNNNSLSPEAFFFKLKHHLNQNLSNILNFSRVT